MVERVLNGQPYVRAETVDFWNVVFNPSTVNRLTHTLIGAFVLGSFFIMSISAWYLLHRKHEDFARRSFTGALLFATVASLGMLLTGHSNADMVAQYQPAKLAAFEGHFVTGPADLHLFGVPDESERRVKYGAAIPGMLSVLVDGRPDATVIGLDKIPRQYWPPLVIPFMSYHIMVALGMFFIALTLFASFLRWRGTLFQQRWLLWVFVVSILGPFIANELGWVAAEVGRQPWIVNPNVVRSADGSPALDSAGMLQYNLTEGLLTRDAVSKAITGGQVLTSIVMFSVIYVLLFWIWLYVLNDKIQKGPKPVVLGPDHGGWLAATAGRTLHEESMSEAKDER
jgi:cytochrome bd ubiquinol oxidase subunit I